MQFYARYQDEVVADPAAIALHVERARDLLSPAFATIFDEALAPPDRDGTDWEALGASADEVRDFAVSGLARRLKIVGVPLDSVVSPPA